MPFSAITAYLNRLPARQAEMKILFADAVSYPHIKKDQQHNMMNIWSKQANMFITPTARIATPGKLRMMGIGVKYVK